MSDINCNACNELKSTSPNFAQNGITNTECTSLAADTGLNPSLNPKHNDAEDLHDMNDCLIGRPANELEDFDVCDWQDFMAKFIPNLYEMIKGIICALGGIWTYIHNLLSRVASLEGRMTSAEGRISALESTVAGHTSQISSINNKIAEIIAAMGGDENTVTVVRKYSYTVPVAKFIQTWQADCTTEGGGTDRVTAWFSGATNMGECYISIPVTEMENVVGVWAQPYVVASGNSFDGKGKDFMETVAVQTWTRQGNNIIINFDTYELAPHRIVTDGVVTQNGGPYPVTVDFLVVGTKTINTMG